MSLKYMQKIVLIWLGLIALPALGWADTSTRQWLDGIAAYKTGDYQKAVMEFKTLAESGIANAKLYYNLGNAYLKAQDLGHAILWYERAMKSAGNDPDLLFNLAYARSLTKDAGDPKSISLSRILFFWKYQLSHRTIVILALSANALFWLLLLLRRFILSKRRTLGFAAAAAALPALLFIVTALYNFYEAGHSPRAVILPKSVSVRSGLSDHATELFVLHAGTVVKIEKRQGEFMRIAYEEDKIGWIKQSSAGII